MDFKKKIAIIALALVFTGVFSAPVAVATDGGAGWAQIIRKAIVRAVAQQALRQLQNRVLSKIRTGGPGGAALFVQNWTNLILNSQYTGENIFRAELSTAQLCDYLADPVKRAFGVDPKIKTRITGQNTRTDSLQPFSLAAQCTLPPGFTLEKYSQDFAGNGGWDTFTRLLEPQNNITGLLALSQDELTKQRKLAEASGVNEALAGKGFTGTRGACKVRGPQGTCLIQGDILTPGSIFDQSTAAALTAPLDFLANADDGSLGLTGAFIGLMVDRLFNIAASQDNTQNTQLQTESSYKEEFCSSKKVSSEAASYIAKNYPQAFKDYPISGGGPLGPLPGPGALFSNGGTSACERVRSQDNGFPYSRCVQACSQAVGLVDSDVIVPSAPPIPSETPTPSPTFTPPPGPEPESLLSDLKAERAKYPQASLLTLCPNGTSLQPETCPIGTMLNAVAWKNRDKGWGLSGKSGGHRCPSPAGIIACDILQIIPSYIMVDVFGDAGEETTPRWGVLGPPPDPVKRPWVAPAQP